VHHVDGLHVIESRGDHVIESRGDHVIESRGDPAVSHGDTAGATRPVVVLVHGSLDRAQSFRRVMRRLTGLDVVAYDRRGYAGSRAALEGHSGDLQGHVTDLLAVVRAVIDDGPADPRVTLVGHSFGGDVVIAAALRAPELLASIGAFEPPMPWLGFRRGTTGARGAPRPWPAIAADPRVEAESFFRRMVGDAAWDRLSEEAREGRRADGRALVADLTSLRGPKPFEVTELRMPSVFGRGGAGSAEHHRLGTAWLATHVPQASLFEIPGATHGAHLSHPDAFASFVEAAVAAGRADDAVTSGEEPVAMP
jgi:pimeloyl-ACP methyl ester carboxylesterase